MGDATTIVELSMTEERFGRYDPAHGTPDPMVRRVATIRIASSTAVFEQTDYGHPGRWNAWEPRGVDARLQPRTPQLRAACEALSAALG